MNYPMKDGQIDPDFVQRVFLKANTSFATCSEDTLAVLLAAQEVMQEIDPDIKVGDRVRYEDDFGRFHHCRFPEIDERDYAFVIFDDETRGIYLKEHLTKIEEAQHGEG